MFASRNLFVARPSSTLTAGIATSNSATGRAPAASFVATSGLLSTRGWYGTPNAPVGDALRAAVPKEACFWCGPTGGCVVG